MSSDHDAASGHRPPADATPKVSRGLLRVAALVFGFVAVVVVVMGITARQTSDAMLTAWTEKQAVPTVAAAQPDTQGNVATLDLPGRLEAYYQAQIYARSSGYLKEWKVDIGAHVTSGQLLAEIEAPDLDQQYVQAQADLASAEANVKLSEATLRRGEALLHSSWVSQQDFDQRTADLGNKQGLVKAAQANVDRLRVLEEYKRIVAPFDGLVTARNTDIGALINAGAAAGPPLFIVSDIHRLRVYVSVPQNYVPNIKIGTRAQISVPEYPGRTFPALVEASAQAVDIASGTTRMQLGVDNANGELMPGAFATLRLDLPPSGTLNIPASALIFDHGGLRVATVGVGERVVLKDVTIGRDLGTQIEIATGLSADDRVIETLPDGVAEGDQVRVTRTEFNNSPQAAKIKSASRASGS
jgi:RND family efflux transporter MFP subunit